MPHRPPSGAPRGFFGVAVYRPKNDDNVGSLWRTANVFGAAFLATVGARYRPQSSDTMKSPRTVPLHHFAGVDDLVQHLPWGCQLVGVECGVGSESLPEFDHPQSALYLLGAEDHGLPSWVLAQCHRVVSVPSPKPVSVNVAVAGSIVVYRRFEQQLQRNADLGVVG